MLATTAPYQQYFDVDGDPLDAGFIYFGQPDQNPETAPMDVYWDSAGTQPVAQPVRTLNGYTMRGGTPSAIFAGSDYSTTVKSRRGELVVYSPRPSSAYNLLYSAASSYPPGSIGAKLSETVSVKDYGALGNGAADDTAAIQATIAKVVSNGGGVVYFPRGTYKTTSTIVVNSSGVQLQGDGKTAVVIAPNFSVGDVIRVGSSAPSTLQSCGVRGMTIQPSVTHTSGAAIALVGNNINVNIDQVLCKSTRIGVNMDSYGAASVYRVDNCYFDGCTDASIILGGANGLLQSCYANRCQIANCGVGIRHSNISGFYASQIDIILCGTAMEFAPAAGQIAAFCFYDTVLADTSSGIGWAVTGGLGQVGNIVCSNCWAAGSTGLAGIYLNSANLDGFTWANGHVRSNAQHGIWVAQGNNVLIEGNQIFNNGNLTNAAYHGIVVSSGITKITISNNLIGRGGFDSLQGAANKQGYGILLAPSATTTNANITNNQLTGNVTGGMSDGTSTTAKIIRGNVGYASRSSGTAQIPVGGATVSVPHGLSVTPNPQDITVTATSSPAGSGISNWYVANVTSTQFEIRANAVVATNAMNFGFQAVIPGG